MAPLVAPASVQSQVSEDASETERYLDLGRLYTLWLYENDFEGLWERFLPEMREALGSPDALDAVKDQIVAQLGVEIELLEETLTEAEGFRLYLRFARFNAFDGRVLVQFALDDDGLIGGFYVRPAPGGAADRVGPGLLSSVTTRAP